MRPLQAKNIYIDSEIRLIIPTGSDREVQGYCDCYQDPNVNVYIPDSCIPSSFFAAKNTLQNLIVLNMEGQSLFWLIEDIKSGKIIGTISLFNKDNFHSRMEISYELHSAYWRKGIMSRCVKAILKYGFEQLGLNRIEATTIVSNSPSIELLKSCGFKLEGILSKYKFYKGQFVDICILGHTEEMFEGDMLYEDTEAEKYRESVYRQEYLISKKY